MRRFVTVVVVPVCVCFSVMSRGDFGGWKRGFLVGLLERGV